MINSLLILYRKHPDVFNRIDAARTQEETRAALVDEMLKSSKNNNIEDAKAIHDVLIEMALADVQPPACSISLEQMDDSNKSDFIVLPSDLQEQKHLPGYHLKRELIKWFRTKNAYIAPNNQEDLSTDIIHYLHKIHDSHFAMPGHSLLFRYFPDEYGRLNVLLKIFDNYYERLPDTHRYRRYVIGHLMDDPAMRLAQFIVVHGLAFIFMLATFVVSGLWIF